MHHGSLQRVVRQLQVFGILLIATTLAAQKTWVVDASNGAGTDFTDLPAAFAKVNDGDRVLVRRGSYNPGRLDKAIRLVAELGAVVTLPLVNRTDFLLTGIGSGKACIVQGLGFYGAGVASVRVQDNKGLIVFTNVRVEPDNNGLFVRRTKAMVLTNCTARHLTVELGELSAVSSTFNARQLPGHGVYATRATLDFAQCSASGGRGNSHLGVGSGIEAEGSSLVIRGNSQSRYVGGGSGLYSQPSIDGNNGSTLVIDPAVTLVRPIAGMVSLKKKQLPALLANGGQTGGNLDIELQSPASHAYVLAVSLPTTPLSVPPFGHHWIHRPTEVVLVIGKQGTTGSTKHRYKVPNKAGLRGAALTFQALSGTSRSLDLTNPVIPVLY